MALKSIVKEIKTLKNPKILASSQCGAAMSNLANFIVWQVDPSTSVQVYPIYEEGNEHIGLTEGKHILINFGNLFFEKLDVLGRYEHGKGILCHELGHVCYTNFKLNEKFIKNMLSDNSWKTEFETSYVLSHVSSKTREHIEKLCEDKDFRMIFSKTFMEFDNIFEDGFIESAMEKKFGGDLISCLFLVREYQFNDSPFWEDLDEEKKKKIGEKALFESLALVYAKYGRIKVKDESLLKTDEFLNDFTQYLNTIDDCVNESKSSSRFAKNFAFFCNVFERYYEEYLVAATKQKKLIDEALKQLQNMLQEALKNGSGLMNKPQNQKKQGQQENNQQSERDVNSQILKIQLNIPQQGQQKTNQQQGDNNQSQPNQGSPQNSQGSQSQPEQGSEQGSQNGQSQSGQSSQQNSQNGQPQSNQGQQGTIQNSNGSSNGQPSSNSSEGSSQQTTIQINLDVQGQPSGNSQQAQQTNSTSQRANSPEDNQGDSKSGEKSSESSENRNSKQESQAKEGGEQGTQEAENSTNKNAESSENSTSQQSQNSSSQSGENQTGSEQETLAMLKSILQSMRERTQQSMEENAEKSSQQLENVQKGIKQEAEIKASEKESKERSEASARQLCMQGGVFKSHKDLKYNVVKYEINDDSIDTYNKLNGRNNLENVGRKTASEAKKVLVKRTKGIEQHGLHAGQRLNIQYYQKDKTSPFDKIKHPQKMSLAVEIIIDESGSMSGYKADKARDAAIIMREFCKELNIPCLIFGHSSNFPTQTIFEYIDWESKNPKEKFRLANISGHSLTRDGGAILYGIAKMKERKEKDKLMFIISDGCPCDNDSYSGDNAKRDIQGLVKQAERLGAKVIAAAIDADKNTINEIYGNDRFLDISDLDALPKKFTAIVKKQLRI